MKSVLVITILIAFLQLTSTTRILTSTTVSLASTLVQDPLAVITTTTQPSNQIYGTDNQVRGT